MGTITAADDYPNIYEEAPEPIIVTPFSMPSDAELHRMTVPDIQELDKQLTKHIRTSNQAWIREHECFVHSGWLMSLYLPAVTCIECPIIAIENPYIKTTCDLISPLIGAYIFTKWVGRPTPEQAAMKAKIATFMHMKEKQD